jgi:hypothetical protein
MALKIKVSTLQSPKLESSGAEQIPLIDALEKDIKSQLNGGWEMIGLTSDGGVVMVIYKKTE